MQKTSGGQTCFCEVASLNSKSNKFTAVQLKRLAVRRSNQNSVLWAENFDEWRQQRVRFHSHIIVDHELRVSLLEAAVGQHKRIASFTWERVGNESARSQLPLRKRFVSRSLTIPIVTAAGQIEHLTSVALDHLIDYVIFGRLIILAVLLDRLIRTMDVPVWTEENGFGHFELYSRWFSFSLFVLRNFENFEWKTFLDWFSIRLSIGQFVQLSPFPTQHAIHSNGERSNVKCQSSRFFRICLDFANKTAVHFRSGWSKRKVGKNISQSNRPWKGATGVRYSLVRLFFLDLTQRDHQLIHAVVQRVQCGLDASVMREVLCDRGERSMEWID